MFHRFYKEWLLSLRRELSWLDDRMKSRANAEGARLWW